jgi:hypothetical protein
MVDAQMVLREEAMLVQEVQRRAWKPGKQIGVWDQYAEASVRLVSLVGRITLSLLSEQEISQRARMVERRQPKSPADLEDLISRNFGPRN